MALFLLPFIIALVLLFVTASMKLIKNYIAPAGEKKVKYTADDFKRFTKQEGAAVLLFIMNFAMAGILVSYLENFLMKM